MLKTKLAVGAATASLIFTLTSSVFAQDASPSPSDSPSPSPSAEATTSAGGTTKAEVLGDTTTLGSTGAEKEIAKWAIALTLAAIVFAAAIKTARSSAKE